jgi:hypothetical protein
MEKKPTVRPLARYHEGIDADCSRLCPGRSPRSYVHVPADATRPLDSTRLVSCGSLEARFEVWLPPGRYLIQGYSQDAYYGDSFESGTETPTLQGVAFMAD